MRSASLAVIPFLRDQQAVPAQNRVGGKERADLGQELVAKDFAFEGQAPPLVVGEEKAAIAQFLLENLAAGSFLSFWISP